MPLFLYTYLDNQSTNFTIKINTLKFLGQNHCVDHDGHDVHDDGDDGHREYQQVLPQKVWHVEDPYRDKK